MLDVATQRAIEDRWPRTDWPFQAREGRVIAKTISGGLCLAWNIEAQTDASFFDSKKHEDHVIYCPRASEQRAGGDRELAFKISSPCPQLEINFRFKSTPAISGGKCRIEKKKVGCQCSRSLGQTQRGVASHEVVVVPAKTAANNTSRKGEKKKKRMRGIQGREEREKVIISRVLY